MSEPGSRSVAVAADSYLHRLDARIAATGTVLCLGLDPDPVSLPPGFAANVRGVEAFARLVLEAAVPFAAAVKPNLAFYEAFGSEGLAALERLRAMVPSDVPVIVDAKRADIGSTAARQAVALFDHLGADAITVNPYLGGAAIAPLLERGDRFAYVLCRTSNPGAGELQDLRVEADAERSAPAEPLWARVARQAGGWGPGGTVGLVVGATAPDQLAAIRAIAPDLPFLVPGVGEQGGDVAAVLRQGPVAQYPGGVSGGPRLLVNVSRAIAAAAMGSSTGRDLGEALATAARGWAERLPVLP